MKFSSILTLTMCFVFCGCGKIPQDKIKNTTVANREGQPEKTVEEPTKPAPYEPIVPNEFKIEAELDLNSIGGFDSIEVEGVNHIVVLVREHINLLKEWTDSVYYIRKTNHYFEKRRIFSRQNFITQRYGRKSSVPKDIKLALSTNGTLNIFILGKGEFFKIDIDGNVVRLAENIEGFSIIENTPELEIALLSANYMGGILTITRIENESLVEIDLVQNIQYSPIDWFPNIQAIKKDSTYFVSFKYFRTFDSETMASLFYKEDGEPYWHTYTIAKGGHKNFGYSMSLIEDVLNFCYIADNNVTLSITMEQPGQLPKVFELSDHSPVAKHCQFLSISGQSKLLVYNSEYRNFSNTIYSSLHQSTDANKKHPGVFFGYYNETHSIYFQSDGVLLEL